MRPDSTAGETCLDAAARALARRDHSASELNARLERKGFDEHERAEAVSTLQRVGYVDDGRFALARATQLAARGVGDAGVRHDLEARGVESELVEAAVASLEPECVRAGRELAKAGGGPKAARTLARRGFAEESIESALATPVADEVLE